MLPSGSEEPILGRKLFLMEDHDLGDLPRLQLPRCAEGTEGLQHSLLQVASTTRTTLWITMF